MNNFTKKDLKVGMIVETRDGRLYITHEFEDELILVNKNGCLQLTDYKQNLLFYNKDSEKLDIINVRKPRKRYQFVSSCWCEAPIIWERKELPRLTEVEKIVLENAMVYDKRPEWIGRDENGTLRLYVDKPKKGEYTWISNFNDYIWFNAYYHLFQFIKWDDSDPYSISDLLLVSKEDKEPEIAPLI